MIEKILKELAESGLAINLAALNVSLRIEQPWDTRTQKIVKAFLKAFSSNLHEADVEYALAYYGEWDLNVAFVITDDKRPCPELGIHLIPIWPTEYMEPQEELQQQMEIVHEYYEASEGHCFIPSDIEALAGNCWHDEGTETSWCLYLWLAISRAIHHKISEYWEGWPVRANHILKEVKEGIYLRNENGVSITPGLDRYFNTRRLESLSTLAEDKYVSEVLTLATEILHADIKEYLLGQDIPGMYDLLSSWNSSLLSVSLPDGYDGRIEEDIEKAFADEGLTREILARQFREAFDAKAIEFFESVAITGPIERYNQYKRVKNMDRVVADTPGAAFVYFELIQTDNFFKSSRCPNVRKPHDIASAVRNHLYLSQGAWRRLAKISIADLKKIYGEFKLTPANHSLVLEIMTEANVENLDAYGHLGIARGMHYQQVKTNIGFYVPVLVAYAQQAALPQERRKNGLSSRELAQEIQSVIDWARHQCETGQPISQTSQWGGFARASEEWHQALYEDELRVVSERYLTQEIKTYGSLRKWESKVGPVVIKGYLIEPMLDRADLLAIGTENSVCVGSASNYTEECVSGRFRIFSVRGDNAMSILTISQQSYGWIVHQHLGYRNSSVDDERQEVGKILAELYGR